MTIGKAHTLDEQSAPAPLHHRRPALFSFRKMKEYAERFYKSKDWQRCRAAYIQEKRGLCERCLAEGIANAGVIVHHIINITPDNINDPEVVLNFDNLELLCRRHHAEAHGPVRRYTVDGLGRITPL